MFRPGEIVRLGLAQYPQAPRGLDMIADKLTFSVPEAVSVTGISRSLLYLEIAAGRLPARKLGRRTVILREDLQAFLKALPAAGNARTAA